MPPDSIELERLITLEHSFNLRDVGGYVTADGRMVRWRTLFRADGLHRLSEGDVDVLRPFGLRTVIDLRTDDEVDKGRFPLEALPARWYQLSILDVHWDPELAPAIDGDTAGFLCARYQDMFRTGGAHFAAAVDHLAAPDGLPAVFHCAAGKDRTGVLAALILSSLGVADEDVIADYALSGPAMQRLVRWATSFSPELAARIDAQPAAHLAAEPEAMRMLLAWIAAEHGSAAELLVALGASPGSLDRLREQLLIAP